MSNSRCLGNTCNNNSNCNFLLSLKIYIIPSQKSESFDIDIDEATDTCRSAAEYPYVEVLPDVFMSMAHDSSLRLNDDENAER